MLGVSTGDTARWPVRTYTGSPGGSAGNRAVTPRTCLPFCRRGQPRSPLLTRKHRSNIENNFFFLKFIVNNCRLSGKSQPQKTNAPELRPALLRGLPPRPGAPTPLPSRPHPAPRPPSCPGAPLPPQPPPLPCRDSLLFIGGRRGSWGRARRRPRAGRRGSTADASSLLPPAARCGPPAAASALRADLSPRCGCRSGTRSCSTT